MQAQFSLLSIVFGMAFVMVFDRMHWRHKQAWATNLMSREDVDRIMRIIEASSEA